MKCFAPPPGSNLQKYVERIADETVEEEGESDKIFDKSVFLTTFKHNQDLKYLPLQSKACLTFEFISWQAASND